MSLQAIRCQYVDNAIKEREECEMDLSDSDEETSDTNASLPFHHTSNKPDDQKVMLHDDVLDQSKSYSTEKGLVNLEERDKFICKSYKKNPSEVDFQCSTQ